MTNCNGIIPDLLPWTARPQADVSPALSPSAANTSTLKQCQAGRFPQFLDPGHHLLENVNISISCPLQAGTHVSCLEEEGGVANFHVSLPSFTLHRRHTVRIQNICIYIWLRPKQMPVPADHGLSKSWTSDLHEGAQNTAHQSCMWSTKAGVCGGHSCVHCMYHHCNKDSWLSKICTTAVSQRNKIICSNLRFTPTLVHREAESDPNCSASRHPNPTGFQWHWVI